MIGFQSSILAGIVLVRSAIQSPNYVTQVSGWTINQDGSVEFNNAVIRGSIISGAPPNGGVAIANAPGFGGNIDLWPQLSNVAGVTFSPAQIFVGRDEVSVSPVTTKPFMQFNSPIVNPNLHHSTFVMRGQSSGAAQDDSNMFIQAQAITFRTATGNGTPGDGGYGVIATGVMLSNGGGVTSSTQVTQTFATDPGGFSPVFAAGRAYKTEICGNVVTTLVSAAPVLEVHKATNVGQRFGSWRIGPTVANFPYGFFASCYFTVGPTADVNANILLTLGGAAGQTVNIFAATDNPTTITIYDVGTAASFPNAPVIT